MHQWHYELDGKLTGPVSETDLQRLRSDGSIQDKTLVWREGLQHWTPFHEVFGTSPAPALGEPTGCARCGMPAAQEELVPIMGLLVCAKCKPLTLQSLREGLDPAANFPRIIAWRDGRHYVVRPGDSELPRRCIKCNTTNGLCSQAQPLTPLSRGVFFETFQVVVFLCEKHARQRRMYGWLKTVALFTSFSVWLLPWVIHPLIRLAISLMAIGVMFYSGSAITIANVRKARKDGVWLSGAGKPFLESLPEWRE